MPRQSTCFQNNVISCSNRSDTAFDARPQIGSPDAEGTAGYLSAIIKRIGGARFNKIIGTEGMLMLKQRGFVYSKYPKSKSLYGKIFAAAKHLFSK